MNREHELQLQAFNDKLQDCADDLNTHIREEADHIRVIAGDIKTIKENHLAHIQIAMEGMKTNMDWLMKFFWLVAAASIGGLITSVFNLMR